MRVTVNGLGFGLGFGVMRVHVEEVFRRNISRRGISRRDTTIKRRLLRLLALPLLSSVLALACTQLGTPGTTPVPGPNPDIEATVSAAVAATVSAAFKTPSPTAAPDPQASDPELTEAARVQATIAALLATPPVPALSAATPVASGSTPAPTLAPLPTATLTPTRAPAQAFPTSQPAPAATPLAATPLAATPLAATPLAATPPTPTATVQPTPTVTLERGCQLAPDGTLVTAWMDGGQVASSQVANGSYILYVEQPEGGSYSGKTMTFKIGDTDANETAIWDQGGGDELALTASTGSAPASAIPSDSPNSSRLRGGLLAQPLPPHILLGTVTLCGAS